MGWKETDRKKEKKKERLMMCDFRRDKRVVTKNKSEKWTQKRNTEILNLLPTTSRHIGSQPADCSV
jgi:hypothetical protein